MLFNPAFFPSDVVQKTGSDGRFLSKDPLDAMEAASQVSWWWNHDPTGRVYIKTSCCFDLLVPELSHSTVHPFS